MISPLPLGSASFANETLAPLFTNTLLSNAGVRLRAPAEVRCLGRRAERRTAKRNKQRERGKNGTWQPEKLPKRMCRCLEE